MAFATLENQLKVGLQVVYYLLSAGFKKYKASDSSDAGLGAQTLVLVKTIYTHKLR